MTRSVVCISHETGAGGRALGQAVADQLGYRIVDEEIVARAATSQGLSVEELADVERRKSFLSRMLNEFGRGEIGMHGAFLDPSADLRIAPSPNTLRGLIRQSIEETADEGNVVIVSHAASYALRDRNDVLRVLVTASPETRIQRLNEAQGMGWTKAEKSIAANDAGRADYLKRFYGVSAELPIHYDVVVNTDIIPALDCAQIVVRAASL